MLVLGGQMAECQWCGALAVESDLAFSPSSFAAYPVTLVNYTLSLNASLLIKLDLLK